MAIKSHKRSYGTGNTVPKKTVFQSTAPTPSIQNSSIPQQGGMIQTLKESVVGGFGAGVGMNIADRAISSIFGARKVEVQKVSSNSSCEDIMSIYKNALSKGETIPQTLEERYNKCIQTTT